MYHVDKDGNLCAASGAAIQCMHQQVDCGTACAAFQLDRVYNAGTDCFATTVVLHCCKRVIHFTPVKQGEENGKQ